MAPLLGQGQAAAASGCCRGGSKAGEVLRIEVLGLSPQPPLLGPRPSIPFSIEEGAYFQEKDDAQQSFSARPRVAAAFDPLHSLVATPIIAAGPHVRPGPFNGRLEAILLQLD